MMDAVALGFGFTIGVMLALGVLTFGLAFVVMIFEEIARAKKGRN